MNFSKLVFILTLMVSANTASAISEVEAREFIAQIDALMNRKNMEEITEFYKFYSDKKATFIKESALVDPNDPDIVIATESLDMNVDQYIKYLKGILSTPSKYSYSSNIDSIVLNESDRTAAVKLTAQDSSVSYGRDDEQKRDYSSYVITTSNCNYSLTYKSAHYYLLGMRCAEKINKTVIYN